MRSWTKGSRLGVLSPAGRRTAIPRRCATGPPAVCPATPPLCLWVASLCCSRLLLLPCQELVRAPEHVLDALGEREELGGVGDREGRREIVPGRRHAPGLV